MGFPNLTLGGKKHTATHMSKSDRVPSKPTGEKTTLKHMEGVLGWIPPRAAGGPRLKRAYFGAFSPPPKPIHPTRFWVGLGDPVVQKSDMGVSQLGPISLASVKASPRDLAQVWGDSPPRWDPPRGFLCFVEI